MPFWAAAQLQPQRDGLALQCLRQAGFETYAPRLREQRTAHGRKVVRTPLLFLGDLFVLIELQWHTARWSPGVVRLVMNGVGPAAVPEAVIADLKARETRGLIEAPATACESYTARSPATSVSTPAWSHTSVSRCC
jgi:transcriptional antiterminator RfaH